MSTGEFNVVQFFASGEHEYVRRNVGAEEAVTTAKNLTTSVGGRIGTTTRVIITDREDFTTFEWIWGVGVTYPPRNAA
jgi:hypothetical protein